MVEYYLLSKCKAQSSNPAATKTNQSIKTKKLPIPRPRQSTVQAGQSLPLRGSGQEEWGQAAARQKEETGFMLQETQPFFMRKIRMLAS
jgi:hypothetical protein